ncbi:unnamed protein product [Malus baccata var. baccata]
MQLGISLVPISILQLLLPWLLATDFQSNMCDTIAYLRTYVCDVTVVWCNISKPDAQAVTWEFVITFILLFTICGVVTDDRAVLSSIFPSLFLYVRSATLETEYFTNVSALARVEQKAKERVAITGASMNHARSFGPAAGTAPILGAIAATVVYSVLRVPKPVKFDEKADPILARNPSQG